MYRVLNRFFPVIQKEFFRAYMQVNNSFLTIFISKDLPMNPNSSLIIEPFSSLTDWIKSREFR